MTGRLATRATVWDVWVLGPSDQLVGEVRFVPIGGRMRYAAVLFGRTWPDADQALGDYASRSGAVGAIKRAFERREAGQ